MRKLVSALLHAVPDFFNVAAFLLFIFILFAILGVYQYNGILYNACRTTEDPILSPLDNSTLSWPIDPATFRVCTITGMGLYNCPSSDFCGNPSDFDLNAATDNVNVNAQINYGITQFDNLGVALLTVF